MSKFVIKRFLVFSGLTSMAFLAVVIYSLLGVRSKPCESSAGFTDGHVYLVDSSASARAWLDNNSDGHRDSTEQSLENVCMWASVELESFDEETMSLLCTDPEVQETLVTDTDGKWNGTFFAGACCSDVYIFAIPPEGYRATTSLVVNDCFGEFGFVPAGSLSKITQVSPTESVLQIQMQQRKEQVFDTAKDIAVVIGVLVVALIGSFVIVRPQIS